MSEENVQVSGGDLARWLLLALLIAACVGAYFAFAPRVPPAVPVSPSQNPA